MIEIIVGPMYSGKSEELIRRLRRAEIAGKRFLVFKSHLDDRFTGTKTIVSRNGLTYPCYPAVNSQVVYDTFLKVFFESNGKAPSIVAIDEAQFFDNGLVRVANFIADMGVKVIICGLDNDYRHEPFGPMPYLLSTAEKVDKLTAVCMECGGEATRTYRKTDDEELIKVGNDIYEARCRLCFHNKK